MTVSFILPLYNCLAHTRECLATLQATLPAGLAHEIIFVDDGSTDGTREWLAALAAPCRALLNERNAGFAATCNRGAAAAAGEVLFFLNNDLVLLPGWFEPMWRHARRRSGIGLVGNVQLNAATGAIDHAGIRFNHQAKPEHDRTRPLAARWRGWRSVPALTGACFAVRREVWHRLGGFDEGVVNGGEDIDLCLRARAAGLRHRVMLRSVVRHHISQAPGRKLRDEQNTERLFLRWRAALVPLAARAWCAVHLAPHWDEPRDFADLRTARGAFLYRWRLWPVPPAAVRRGVEQAIEIELARWRALAGPGAG